MSTEQKPVWRELAVGELICEGDEANANGNNGPDDGLGAPSLAGRWIETVCAGKLVAADAPCRYRRRIDSEPEAAPFSAWSDEFSPWVQALDELKDENDSLRAKLAETQRHLKAAMDAAGGAK